MKNNNTTIQVTYNDVKLRVLIEEFIAMQKADFTFKKVCSYILYRAMKEDKTTTNGLYDSNQLDLDNSTRVNTILEKILDEERIMVSTDSDNKIFKKTVE